jgi:hypothetical protein
MPPYRELFPHGTPVRIKRREALLEFQRSWRFHHPLTDDMIAQAGSQGTVSDVSFYHGGDVLYGLEGIPGTWHEICLEAVS